MTFPWGPNGGGYKCINCGAWVPNGTTHSCTWIFPTAPATVDWTPSLIASIDRLREAVERLIELMEED